MRDLAKRSFWQATIPLWRVIVIVLALGTLPGFGAAVILSAEIAAHAHEQLALSQQQIRQGCERSNRLRREVNARGAGLLALQDGVIDFMRQARDARRNKNGTSYDPELADRYERDIAKAAAVPYEPLPITDCDAAFKFVSSDAGPVGIHTAAATR